jgi:aminoglycoside phosphotransferase (APT) family kinase protein
MPIDPASRDDVAKALLAYLSTTLRPDISLEESPEPLGRGFDTHIYAFRLKAAALDAAWARPLVLRLYTTPSQADKAEGEAVIQRFAAQRGYPALDPLAVERCAEPFGLPLMVMERVEGVPMLDKVGFSPFAARRLFAKMAAAHVALHRLPIEGCPLQSNGPLIERELKQMRDSGSRATKTPSQTKNRRFAMVIFTR